VVWVEIIGPMAGIAVTPGGFVWRKRKPGKPSALKVVSRISFAQMPYLGEGARAMGVRIGRAAQAFEIGELIVTPHEPVDVRQLSDFLSGLLEGRESRFKIQEKTYARKVSRVRLRLQDLYQFVRDREREPMIVADPTGMSVMEASDLIEEIFKEKKRVNILAGAREGVPKGVFRFASLVVDLCPGLTFATEHTIPAAICALLTCLEERGVL
jgi:tRNA acetyltransferase TAN1